MQRVVQHARLSRLPLIRWPCPQPDFAIPPSPPSTDIVTSLVNADDVVPRACMRSLAGLLEELAR